MKIVRLECGDTSNGRNPRRQCFFFWLGAGLALAIAVVTAPAAIVKGRVYVDLDGDGHSDPSEPGVEHVAVSDGQSVVQTSETGAYEIEPSNSPFVFVSLPRGYRTLGSFYSKAQSAGPIDFGSM
jgi:hypothetical protein